MTDNRTMRVMSALGGRETPAQSLFVGGCVRNMVLGADVTDIDIATLHRPLQVMGRLGAAGIRYIPTGLEHGTITALIDGMSFEITTLRKDIDTNGRHAVISFSDSWQEDAARRDFTINTLLADTDGAVFDPTGAGLSDIDARKVIFVGDAAQRISEDYLRLLRFFRFHARYGSGAPDKDAIAACKAHAQDIEKLSKERVTQELLKIFSLPNPHDALTPMFGCGVFPELAKSYNGAALQTLCDLQIRYDYVRAMPRFLAIAGMNSSLLDRRFLFSNAQKKEIAGLSEAALYLNKTSSQKVRETVYRYGNNNTAQACLLIQALQNNVIPPELMDIARYWQAPVFPVKARDLMEEGMIEGPLLGKKLKELEQTWISKDFPASFTHKK